MRGGVSSGPIPQSETEPTRLAVRRTMKQLSGPYNAFDQYYPLEDAIELYNEIWYESSSSDEWAKWVSERARNESELECVLGGEPTNIWANNHNQPAGRTDRRQIMIAYVKKSEMIFLDRRGIGGDSNRSSSVC